RDMMCTFRSEVISSSDPAVALPVRRIGADQVQRTTRDFTGLLFSGVATDRTAGHRTAIRFLFGRPICEMPIRIHRPAVRARWTAIAIRHTAAR
ncbi:MAG: hypothetical protein ABW224_11675, partial [Kibdelosporangium sp.]